MVCRLDSVGLIHKKMIILRLWQSLKRTETPEYLKKNENDNAVLIEVLKTRRFIYVIRRIRKYQLH